MSVRTPLPARAEAPIEDLRVASYTVPTDAPEGDGTLRWDATTIVVVQAHAGDHAGTGYAYAGRSAATLVHEQLASAVRGVDALDVGRAWRQMVAAVRNLGRPGVASCAIAAVDVALWDLKARLLDLPLARLLGAVRERVPVYGSGGFTTYCEARLVEQLGGWAQEGMRMVKMKVGADPQADPARVRAARAAIGADTRLFVDANGAYGRKQALSLAERFAAESDVTWFEEPVSSDDLDGLRLLRDRAPAGMAVAAGEYGYDLPYFRAMLATGAVDVLQADVTRCCGITGLLGVGALCDAHCMPLSTHTAPAIHVHAGCAIGCVVHLEWFHDHARIEELLFDGAPRPAGGTVTFAPDRPGLGLRLRSGAERYAT
jgi:L-alanine-DL-glutamate epimerase-like enolase superfamily enzyme